SIASFIFPRPRIDHLPQAKDSGAAAPASSPEMFGAVDDGSTRAKREPAQTAIRRCRFCDAAPGRALLHNPRSCRSIARAAMKIDDVRRTAYSMPLTNPAFPMGPYRFFNREFFVVTYRTDREALAAVVPEPLEVVDGLVNYEFIRMP